MNKTKALWVHMQLWYILHFCHVLKFKKEEFDFKDKPEHVKGKKGQQRLGT